MEKTRLMKDKLGRDSVMALSQSLSVIIADFPQDQFIAEALVGLDGLELKQRVQYLIAVLADYLPEDFKQSASFLLAVKQVWDDSDQTEYWGNFTAWPLIDYVAVYGLEQPELALNVLKTLTPLFTAEFAIRPFIEQHFELTYQHLLIWCDDKDEHVRRLASEGIRPRLPWGKQLSYLRQDPQAIFPILEKLKDDPSLYVRKSVANNLNDISKDHPDKVVALCQHWIKDASKDRLFIIRQALRSLVKVGRQDVFPLLGYTARPNLELVELSLNKDRIQIGNTIEIFATIISKSDQDQSIVLDYKVHHVKANGTTTAKVFKWKKLSLQPKQSVQLTKKHSFKLISTRHYYSGIHSIEILINGKTIKKITFELID